MKRALLIAGGTVGGLGAVLAVTPPQFMATQDVAFLSGALAVGTPTQTTPSARQPSVAAKIFSRICNYSTTCTGSFRNKEFSSACK